MEDDDLLPEIQSEKEPRKEKLSSTISPYLKKSSRRYTNNLKL